MKMVFCTLFDSNYLDKGLVCYESLENVCNDFVFFVLPMDKKCTDVLKDINYSKLKSIDYEQFEDNELKAVKRERGRAEFCWTCTAKLIDYVLSKYDEDICTYIDADLYFYRNPEVLIKEMLNDGKSVQIIKHNFPKAKREIGEKGAGTYCVEFNTFLKKDDAFKVLKKWESDCINECSYGINNEVLGDQKYLNNWPDEYGCINVSTNQGAGVAPWNVNKFKFFKNEKEYIIRDLETNEKYNMVFFHFQNIQFIEKNIIRCCWTSSRNYRVLKSLYTDYLVQIIEKKQMLDRKYGIKSLIKVHPADEGKEIINSEKKTLKEIVLILGGRIKRVIGINNELIVNVK